MEERRVRLSWVEAVIRSPDWVARDRDPDLAHSFKAISEVGDRIPKVVHRAEGADIPIVTAYFDRGARRP